MNVYCRNQNQGLKARQHTSTHLFHWVSCHKLSTTFPTPSPPHPPAPGGCISHKQKNETWLLVVVQFYPRLIFYLPWEQWFLHPGCYATKREKPLQATVNFSTEHACPSDVTSKCQDTSSCFARNIRNLNIQRSDGNETVNKTIALISKTTTCKCNTMFYASHYCFCTTMTWKCIISCFIDNVNKQQWNFISLPELGYGPRNSTPVRSAYIWQSKLAGMNNPNKYWIEKAQIHSRLALRQQL